MCLEYSAAESGLAFEMTFLSRPGSLRLRRVQREYSVEAAVLWVGFRCRYVWSAAWRGFSNARHNKTLHPTAASVVVCAAFRLYSKLVVIGRRRVSLVVVPMCAALMPLMRPN